MIEELYSDLILELNKRPLNKKSMSESSAHFHDTNPFCGDEITLYLKINNSGVIEDASFQGKGCALSQASASLCTELARGKMIKDILNLNVDAVLNELGIPQVKKNAVRIKCVLLPLKALKMCAYNFLDGEN